MVGVGLVGTVVLIFGVAGFDAWRESLRPPLPYRNALTQAGVGLTAFDDERGRARFVDGGYELSLKRPDAAIWIVPEMRKAQHLHVEVTALFRRAADQPPDSTPSAGLVCRRVILDDPDGKSVSAFYDFRLTADGRYAVYRHVGDDYRVLGSSAGIAPLNVYGAMRLAADCGGWRPTYLRFYVDGVQVLSVVDPDPLLDFGHAGFIIGSDRDADFTVLFRDFFVRELEWSE